LEILVLIEISLIELACMKKQQLEVRVVQLLCFLGLQLSQKDGVVETWGMVMQR